MDLRELLGIEELFVFTKAGLNERPKRSHFVGGYPLVRSDLERVRAILQAISRIE